MSNNYSSLSKKGQITIPASVRNKLHLNSNSKLEYIIHDGYLILAPINKEVKELKGFLSKPSFTLSIEEIDNIIKRVE
jgi:AbrB family looped-hinge helix DNA binding protein